MQIMKIIYEDYEVKIIEPEERQYIFSDQAYVMTIHGFTFVAKLDFINMLTIWQQGRWVKQVCHVTRSMHQLFSMSSKAL